MDAAYLANRGQLLRLIRYFRLAALLLMTEVVAWVGSLISQA
jgi:hypothetical protein